jgi:signal transduction histidine kinase
MHLTRGGSQARFCPLRAFARSIRGTVLVLGEALTAVAAHFALRRESVIQVWCDAVAADPALKSGRALPATQLLDHIPALLEDYEHRLAATGKGDPAELQRGSDAQRSDAEAHGLHRWQQGFDLAEVIRELSQLNECVVAELHLYAEAHPQADRRVLAVAHKVWAKQIGAAISASASHYFKLQQLEASGHIQELEHALDSLRELERQRASLWQQAAHDLRGNLGVVANVAAVLTSPQLTEEHARHAFLRMLERNIRALHYLLKDVTTLARLQGGLERLSVARIDAGGLLGDLCESMEPYAQDRGLYLRCRGVRPYWIDGDAVKIWRVAQNLVINAIKYTRQGGVTVAWQDCAADDADRWCIEVHDTGPSPDGGPRSQLASALEAATDQAAQVSASDNNDEVTHAQPGSGTVPSPLARSDAAHGDAEGIGLSIVKRLCELLNATVELETSAVAGTRFRILLPRRYPS